MIYTPSNRIPDFTQMFFFYKLITTVSMCLCGHYCCVITVKCNCKRSISTVMHVILHRSSETPTGHHTMLLPARKKPPTVARLVRTIACNRRR